MRRDPFLTLGRPAVICPVIMKNERPPWLVASALLFAGLQLVACRKTSDRPKWDVDLLAPVITTSMSIGDLVPDSLLVVDANGALSLIYRSELFAVSLDSVLQAPDTTFDYRYALPFGPVNFPAGATFFSDQEVTRFDLQDVALRYLELREGELELQLKNKVASRIIGTLSLPGATLAGSPALLTTSVDAGSPSQPTTAFERRSLAGAVFDLRGPQFNAVNTLSTSIVAQLDPNGSGATVTEADSLVALVNYYGLVPQYARGYFGSQLVEVEPRENALDLFNNIVGGTLDLDAVSLKLVMVSGLGMDLQVRLRELLAINSRTGAEVALNHSIMNGPVNLSRAIDLGNGFTPTTYQTTLNNSNSNVDLFVENLPDKVRFALDLNVNPLGDISNGNDFVYYDSKLRADLELEIPLRLITNELTLQTLIRPELPGTVEGHGLREGELRIFASNGFPFSARLELAIVNAAGEVLSTANVQGTIGAGMLGSNGLVQQSTSSRVVAPLSPDQVDLLYGDNQLRLRSVFNTADQSQHIQLFEHYRLDLQVTASVNYLVNGDE